MPDPAYTGEVPGTTSDTGANVDIQNNNPMSDTDFAAAIRSVGLAYWQAQTDGNYDLWYNIHCTEDQLLRDVVRDPETFANETGHWQLQADLRELIVNFSIRDDRATVSFDGVIGLTRDEQTSTVRASDFDNLQLVVRNGRWLICENADRGDEIFRPGGR